MTATTGNWAPEDLVWQQKNLTFMIQQLISALATSCSVQVVSCSNDGGVAAVGTVTVQPLIDQIDGNKVRYPHGQLYQVPYSRLQGGKNAIIIDPQPGDIGQVIFMSRDNTAVRSAALGSGLAAGSKTFGPASFRQYNWSDGWFVAAYLNVEPVNYVQFDGNDINVLATGNISLSAPEGEITLTAPTINLDASTTLAITSPATSLSGTATAVDDVTGEMISLHNHVHSGVSSGSSDTGPPVP